MNLRGASTAGYEDVALGVLAYEFSAVAEPKTDETIKRRLRDKKVGPFDKVRIAQLRQFKNAVQNEITRFDQSKYFTGTHGRYAELEDFDRDRMCGDYAGQFPGIPRGSVQRFVDFAVFIYYVR